MLEDVFAEFKKYYHASSREDSLWHIAPDCPPERVEELRVVDTQFFEEQGTHLFDIFLDEDNTTESTSQEAEDN